MILDPLFDADGLTVTARLIGTSIGDADFLALDDSGGALDGGGGADALFGGAGDDTIGIGDDLFHFLDGGGGEDRLAVNFDLDLTGIRDDLLADFEVLDLRGGGDNLLTLDVGDVIGMTDADNTLTVQRDGGDDYVLIGEATEWTEDVGARAGYTVLDHDTEDATIIIENVGG